ncbi:MAG: rhomboid family intramembrane serine protease [Actinomycetota bacterium]|nr:rhomboid family intramembrane serine protease [Actinomycetota bacterium]
MTAATVTGRHTGLTNAPARRPALTVVVCAVVVAVSVVAAFSPALMDLFTRDLARLRAGQWWRAFTPVLVQPDGWGQLAFNLLGLTVVGAAVERRVSRACWALIFLLGGPGSIAVLSVWKPADTGGGSSDAVAALLGAFILLQVIDSRVIDDRRMRWEWAPQAYAVFFASYLTTLDLAGLVPSILVGNASIVAFFVARRAVPPVALSRACSVVVLVAGVLMTVAHDGHGTGILAGIAVASLVLAWRRLLDRAGGSLRLVQMCLGVVCVWALCLLGWVAWARLLGVDLVVAGSRNSRVEVGWASVSVLAITVCLLALAAEWMLRRHWPRLATRVWVGLCAIVAGVSLGGPLALAVGPTSRAALIFLHLACAAGVVALLAPLQDIRAGAARIPDDGDPVPVAGPHLVGRSSRATS